MNHDTFVLRKCSSVINQDCFFCFKPFQMQLLQSVDKISNDRNPGSVGTRDIEGYKLLPKVRNSCPTNEVFLPQLLLFSENTFFFPFFDTFDTFLLFPTLLLLPSLLVLLTQRKKKRRTNNQFFFLHSLLPTQILLASGDGPGRNVFFLLLFNGREGKRKQE